MFVDTIEIALFTPGETSTHECKYHWPITLEITNQVNVFWEILYFQELHKHNNKVHRMLISVDEACLKEIACWNRKCSVTSFEWRLVAVLKPMAAYDPQPMLTCKQCCLKIMNYRASVKHKQQPAQSRTANIIVDGVFRHRNQYLFQLQICNIRTKSSFPAIFIGSTLQKYTIIPNYVSLNTYSVRSMYIYIYIYNIYIIWISKHFMYSFHHITQTTCSTGSH